MSYAGHLLVVGSNPSAEMQSMYYTALADYISIVHWSHKTYVLRYTQTRTMTTVKHPKLLNTFHRM